MRILLINPSNYTWNLQEPTYLFFILKNFHLPMSDPVTPVTPVTTVTSCRNILACQATNTLPMAHPVTPVTSCQTTNTLPMADPVTPGDVKSVSDIIRGMTMVQSQSACVFNGKSQGFFQTVIVVAFRISLFGPYFSTSILPALKSAHMPIYNYLWAEPVSTSHT